jgi:ATP-binding cassette subfamily B multidrug efflux pump
MSMMRGGPAAAARGGGPGPGHGPFGRMGAPGGTATNAKAAAGRLLQRLDRQRRVLFLVLFLTAAATGTGLLGPKLLGDATTHVFNGLIGSKLPAGMDKATIVAGLRAQGKTRFADMLASMDVTPGVGVDFTAVGRIIYIVVALYVLAALLNWVSGWLMAGVAQQTVFELRHDVQYKLGRVPLKYVDGQSRGDLLSRVTNDIDNIGNTLQQGLNQLLNSVLMVVGTLVVMFFISPILAIVSLVIVPVSIGMTAAIAKRSQVQFAAQWRETGKVNGHVEEMHTGHAIVLAYNRRGTALKEFDEFNDALFESSRKAQFLSGIMMPLMQAVGNLNYVIIAILGGIRVANGQLSLGGVQAFIQYSRQFTMPLGQIAALANQVQSGLASAERVFEVLDAVEEELELRGSKQRLVEPRGQVVLDNVSFRYLPDQPLIDHVNVRVEPGKTVAIVGPTGAGKTTIVNLLMRFYDIDEGRITLDGVDTRDIAREDLRSHFGMVLQDTWLFNGTIRENIAYGRTGASDAEIIEAAKEAHADHFIRTLPNGYDTVLDDDATNISVGERQLLTIARAFLADPTVLILDEATSNVDTRTEVLIQEAMNRLRHGRTGFVIAHRLSTIRNADTILVMDHGRIVEQGSHEQLIASGGFYKKLYDSQFAEA